MVKFTVDLSKTYKAYCIYQGTLHLFESEDDFVEYSKSSENIVKGVSMGWLNRTYIHEKGTEN